MRRISRSPVGALALAILLVAFAFGCTSEIDSMIDRAHGLQESGELEESIAVLRGVLEKDPDHPKANFLLGIALVQSEKFQPAIAPLEIATASDLYAIPAGLLLASTQFRTQRFEESVRTCNDILELDPHNLTAIFTRGQSYMGDGNVEAALADANTLLGYRPGAQNAIMMKSRALIRLNRIIEAEAVWVVIRNRTAENGTVSEAARGCARLAHYYQTRSQRDRADATYTECLEQYPSNVYLQDVASEYYVRVDQTERAIALHRRAVESNSEDIRAWGRLSRILHQFGEPVEAQRTLEEAVERFDSPASWRLLAEFHRKTRNPAEAVKALDASIQRMPLPSEAILFSLAMLLTEDNQIERAKEVREKIGRSRFRHFVDGAISLRTGDPGRALAELDQGLTLWPKNVNGRFLAGEAALALRDRSRAITEFQLAIQLGDNDTDATLRLAQISFANGNYPIAWTLARHQIAWRPYLDATPYHIAIRSAIAMKKIEDAAGIANAFLEDHPETPAAIVEMSAVDRVRGGADRSSKGILGRGRDLTDPNNEPILRALASDLNALNRGEEALAFVDDAIALDDEIAALHDLRGRISSHLGRTDEARQSTERALEIDPRFAPALEMRAFFAIEAGDQAAALAAMDAASDAAPLEREYPYLAAGIASKMDDTPGAISRLEESLLRQPSFGSAANDLAWILATDRIDLDRALNLAQIAVHRSRSTKTLTTLGWVRHQRGEYEDAIKNYHIALEANSNVPTVRYRLGLSLSKAGRTNEAMGLFDALVDGPDFPEIEAARAELKRIEGS
jgi:tetratricopeptide (TPR) repeat protein